MQKSVANTQTLGYNNKPADGSDMQNIFA